LVRGAVGGELCVSPPSDALLQEKESRLLIASRIVRVACITCPASQ
jgi:hypothetical protein